MKYAEALAEKDAELKKRFQAFSSAVEEINRITGELTSSGRNMEEADFTGLKNAYVKALWGFGGIEQLIKDRKSISPVFIKNVREVGKMLYKDYTAFRAFDPDLRLPLSDQIETAHSLVVDVTQMKNRVVKGDNSNVRIGMKVKVNDRFTDGLFTEEKYYDGNAFPMQLLDAKENGEDKYSPNFKKMIHEMIDICRENKIPCMEYISNLKWSTYRGSVVFDFADPNTHYENPRTLFKDLAFFKLPKPERFEIYDQMQDFIPKLSSADQPNEVLNVAGIPLNSRLDQRNSALTAVAELLGMDDQIAKSHPMVIKDQNGLHKGTFMEFISDASDTKNLKENDPLLEVTEENLDASTGMIKSAADLQVLDFICGNIDRHQDNVMYQVSGEKGKQKVTKLIGIDHDCSFGILSEFKLTEGIHRLPGISHMGIIRKSTADVLNKLTPEALRSALTQYSLSEDEVNAACDRLALLKKSLNDCYLKSKKIPDFQKMVVLDYSGAHFQGKDDDSQPCVYVLDDSQIDRLKLSDLQLKRKNDAHYTHRYNLFTMVHDQIQYVQEHNRGKKIENKPEELPEVPAFTADSDQKKEVSAKPKFSYRLAVKKLEKTISDLEQENKGFFIGSPEYDNVLAYTKLLHRELTAIAAGELILLEKDQLSDMFGTLNSLAQVYLDKKDQEDLGKDRNARRAFAVQTLADYTADLATGTNLSDKDHYRHLCYEKRIGAFDRRHNSSRISKAIKTMTEDQNKRFAALQVKGARRAALFKNQLSISHIFDGVSQKVWKETLKEYKAEEARYSAVLSNLPEGDLKNSLEALKAAAVDKHPNAGSMAAEEQLLQTASTAAADYLKNADDLSPAEVVAANGLIRLAQKAHSQDASPVSGIENIKMRLAEQMLENGLKDPKNAEKIPALKDPVKCSSVLKRITESENFRKQTENKKPEQLKKLLQQGNKIKAEISPMLGV